MLKHSKKICSVIILAALLTAGCSSNQTAKNAWKGTKGAWYTYVSPPASINYDDKGEMDAYEVALATRMMGIDIQLTNLERVMNNADKPPTGDWMQMFFGRFPWMSGFAGVKADGTIIGQEPSMPMKPLDFSPLLEEDKKQNVRAIRGYVQDTPMGPEVFLGTPLYDAQDFLGMVVAHFDMRGLLNYSTNADELIILAPQAVLWSGNYDVAATPLASVKWDEVVATNSKGTVSGGGQTFYWVARYLGNQPLIFAVPVENTKSTKQAGAEPKQAGAEAKQAGKPEVKPIAAPDRTAPGMSRDLQPGSQDSMLLPANTARPSPFGPGKAPEERKLD